MPCEFTAGLAPKGGEVSEAEIQAFLARGGTVKHIPTGKGGIDDSQRNTVFRQAFRNGGRVSISKDGNATVKNS